METKANYQVTPNNLLINRCIKLVEVAARMGWTTEGTRIDENGARVVLTMGEVGPDNTRPGVDWGEAHDNDSCPANPYGVEIVNLDGAITTSDVRASDATHFLDATPTE